MIRFGIGECSIPIKASQVQRRREYFDYTTWSGLDLSICPKASPQQSGL